MSANTHHLLHQDTTAHTLEYDITVDIGGCQYSRSFKATSRAAAIGQALDYYAQMVNPDAPTQQATVHCSPGYAHAQPQPGPG